MTLKTTDLIFRHYFKACVGSVVLFVLLTFSDHVYFRTQKDWGEPACGSNGINKSAISPPSSFGFFKEYGCIVVGVYLSILCASSIRMYMQHLSKLQMLKEHRKAYFDIFPIGAIIGVVMSLGICSTTLKLLPYYWHERGDIASLQYFNFEWAVWNCVVTTTPLIAFSMISMAAGSSYTTEQLAFFYVIVIGLALVKFAIFHMVTTQGVAFSDKLVTACILAVCMVSYFLITNRIKKIADRDIQLSSNIEKNALKTIVNHDNQYLFIGLLAYRQLTLARILFIGMSSYTALIGFFVVGFISFDTLEVLVLTVSSTFHVLFSLLGVNAGLEVTHRSLYQWDIEEKAHADRRAFLRYVFHEVRVPLNSISLGIELLTDVNLTDTDRETVIMMREAASFMGETLNDVLAIQRIEEGALKLIAKPFSIDDLICVSIEPFLALAEDKGVQVISSISPDVPMFVTGDKYRLKHVLMNLISNAVKFSRVNTSVKVIVDSFGIEDEAKLVESGLDLKAFRKLMQNSNKVDVQKDHKVDSHFTGMFEASGRSLDEGESCIAPQAFDSHFYTSSDEGLDPGTIIYQFCVHDEGSGISPANIENLFNPFLTNHTGELKKGRGTGAGLAISNEIVKLHGGAIHVKSDINIGSVFTVYVPLQVIGKDSPEYNSQASLSTASIDFENQYAIKASIESTQTSRHFAIFNENGNSPAGSRLGLENSSRSSDTTIPIDDGAPGDRSVVVENMSLLSDDESSVTNSPFLNVSDSSSRSLSYSTSPTQSQLQRKTHPHNSVLLPPRYKINNKNVCNVAFSEKGRSDSTETPPLSATAASAGSFSQFSSLNAPSEPSAVNIDNAAGDESRRAKSKSKSTKLNSQEMHVLSSIGLQPLKPDVFPNLEINKARNSLTPVMASPNTTPRIPSNENSGHNPVFLNSTLIENYESWVAALDRLYAKDKEDDSNASGQHSLCVSETPTPTNAMLSARSKRSSEDSDISSVASGLTPRGEMSMSGRLFGVTEQSRSSSASRVMAELSDDKAADDVVAESGAAPSLVKRRYSLKLAEALALQARDSTLASLSPPSTMSINSARSHSESVITSRGRKDSYGTNSTASSNSTTPRDTYSPDTISGASEQKQRAHSFCASGGDRSCDTSPRSTLFNSAGARGGSDDFMVGIADVASPRTPSTGDLGASQPSRLSRSYTVSATSVNKMMKLEPLRGLKAGSDTPSSNSSKVSSPSGSFHYTCFCGLATCNICTRKTSSGDLQSVPSSGNNSAKSNAGDKPPHQPHPAGSHPPMPMTKSLSVGSGTGISALGSVSNDANDERRSYSGSECSDNSGASGHSNSNVGGGGGGGGVEHREFKRHVLNARGQSVPQSPAVDIPVVETPMINALIVDGERYSVFSSHSCPRDEISLLCVCRRAF
jgi:signal transduction histidine kinase